MSETYRFLHKAARVEVYADLVSDIPIVTSLGYKLAAANSYRNLVYCIRTMNRANIRTKVRFRNPILSVWFYCWLFLISLKKGRKDVRHQTRKVGLG